jgi:SAM-dependent methyltransferase
MEAVSEAVMQRNRSCRACKGEELTKILDLGRTALANAFLAKEQFPHERSFPLQVYFCNRCSLVQLIDVVAPEILFSHYAYFTSASSKTLPAHFMTLAQDLAGDPGNRFVVEIGSNDGVLLRALKEYGIDALGVEPAANVAQVANAQGVETLNDFFTEALSRQIVKAKGRADVVIANNVVAHINDLEDLIRGVGALLKDTGRFIFEVHHVADLIANKGFDQIYHEHLSYFSLTVLCKLFQRFDMNVFDVKIVPIHGQCLRVYVGRRQMFPESSRSVQELLKEEESRKLPDLGTYLHFGSEVESIKRSLLDLLRELKSENKRIIGYGAPAKGTTLLNYCGIGPETVDYVIDTTPSKQNLFTPGTHIPVYPPEKLKQDRMDYLLLLAWNYADEILKKEMQLREQGVRFIVPIPAPRIVS